MKLKENWLRELLEKNNMPLVDFSKATGIGYSTVAHYVKGRTMPCIANLILISKTLGVSIDEFFENKGNKDENYLILKNISEYKNANTVGKRIELFRKKNNMTQDQFLDIVNGRSSLMNKYEIGTEMPSLNLLTKIADRLNVPVTFLIENKYDEYLRYVEKTQKDAKESSYAPQNAMKEEAPDPSAAENQETATTEEAVPQAEGCNPPMAEDKKENNKMKLELEEIRRFAEVNWSLPEEEQLCVDAGDVALTNPWIDRSARFPLSDTDAVKEWGMAAVLEFCVRAEERILEERKNGILCGFVFKYEDYYSVNRPELEEEDRRDIMRILKKYETSGDSENVDEKTYLSLF